MKTLIVSGICALSLSACASTGEYGDQYTRIIGPAPSVNTTPYDEVLQCYAGKISPSDPIRISVGQISDVTGKFSYEASEGGFKVTQGGALMVMSALGKLSPAVALVERFDTSIADVEMKLAQAKLIREDNTTLRNLTVGQIVGSDYYIVGGITEINYNIQSGGSEAYVANIGGGVRYYVMNVAVDLRLVDTVSLEVVETVSLQKQIVGREVKAGTYRFFDNTLLDINIGNKSQEPVQLGVRSTLQAATLELVEAVFKKDLGDCTIAMEEIYQEALVLP